MYEIASYCLDKDGKTPIQCTPEQAHKLLGDAAARTVEKTKIPPRFKDEEETEVSTVFLVFDHNVTGSGPPVLWETMVFGPNSAEVVDRYTSYEDAKLGHKRAVWSGRGGLKVINGGVA